METVSIFESIRITLLNADMSSFHTISRKMIWPFKTLHKSGIEKDIDDVHKYNVYYTKNKRQGEFHIRYNLYRQGQEMTKSRLGFA